MQCDMRARGATKLPGSFVGGQTREWGLAQRESGQAAGPTGPWGEWEYDTRRPWPTGRKSLGAAPAISYRLAQRSARHPDDAYPAGARIVRGPRTLTSSEPCHPYLQLAPRAPGGRGLAAVACSLYCRGFRAPAGLQADAPLCRRPVRVPVRAEVRKVGRVAAGRLRSTECRASFPVRVNTSGALS